MVVKVQLVCDYQFVCCLDKILLKCPEHLVPVVFQWLKKRKR